MLSLLLLPYRLLNWVPADLIALIARISVGTVFFRSGLTKLDEKSWAVSSNAFYLFANEYKLPLIPPNLAAYLATTAELALPLLLWAGLLSRLSALALLLMTLVIQVFVYPNAFDTHGVWAVALLFIILYGPGRISLDWLLGDRATR